MLSELKVSGQEIDNTLKTASVQSVTLKHFILKWYYNYLKTNRVSLITSFWNMNGVILFLQHDNCKFEFHVTDKLRILCLVAVCMLFNGSCSSDCWKEYKAAW